MTISATSNVASPYVRCLARVSPRLLIRPPPTHPILQCIQLPFGLGDVFKIIWGLIKNIALMFEKDLSTPNPGKEARLETLEAYYRQRREDGKGSGLPSEDVGGGGGPLRTRSSMSSSGAV